MDARDLRFLSRDYELDTFTVSRNNKDVGSLMVEQGVTCKAILLILFTYFTYVSKGAAQ